ncbi:MAG: LysM peptidoglycan-binding domain-containing protein [Peptococcaceae bacterium]|jgi:LysM repeat protein|nr:LysM peptidoglycan-binding domain-containing protein [Peptococcaceae bacterium]
MAISYTVQTGDTLFLIAQRYGTTIERIVQANNIENPDLIRVGQVLVIPVDEDDNGAGDNQDTGNDNATMRVGGLLYTITTDRRTYNQGDPVRITFTKRNISNRTIVLRYRTSQRFDLIVRRGTEQREVWRWSAGRSFAQATASVRLQPGERQVFRATWDQRNNRGQQVAPGNYTIEAVNVATGLANQSVSISIRIRQVAPTPTPTAAPCADVNILTNPGFERWPNRLSPPPGWTGSNLVRSTRSFSGNYAAEMGANASERAVLAQRVDIEPGRIYELSWQASEHVQSRIAGRFILFVEIFYYNRNGEFVGRTEPRYSQDNIPNNRYQGFSLSTGRVPAGARVAEVRFTFEPSGNNANSVLIDQVDFRCRF